MIATLLSAYLTSLYPVSASFIPQDKAYGISLTLYSGLFVVLFKCLDYFFDFVMKNETTVQVEFSANKPDFKKLELVHCDFSRDIATVYMKVKLTGYPRKFLQKK